MKDLARIRNFCIIAHVDHGKSTLADRLLQATHSISLRDFRDQVLDDMDLERERGITIKAHPVTMKYTAADGLEYELNLIDTPGHVDFSYEVARSLQACDGALLVIDAGQGVQAQTVANTFLAAEHNLCLVPVINKIDLPSADLDSARRQLEDILALPGQDALLVSAKTGQGIEALLEAIVTRMPAPKTEQLETRALVFDSMHDTFRGAVAYVRVVDGELKAGDRIRLMSNGRVADIKEVGQFAPKPRPCDILHAGEVGYLVANIKEPTDLKIGDTITQERQPAATALPGFKIVRPMVFSGLYPVNTADYEKLRLSLEKLGMNDSAFVYQPESSMALGFGFRCGFLGLLHMEIVQERLRREYDMDILTTYPGVVYRVHLKSGKSAEIDNPVHLPDPSEIEQIEEPIIRAFVICQNEHIGDLLKLIQDRRGALDKTESLDKQRVMLTCTLPLNEILVDFHDRLKSITRGYASMDYELAGYRADDMVKLDILVHSEPVDAFSSIVHRSKAALRGRGICQILKDVIPPAMFPIALQAAINKNIIARETIRAYRKDVLAKCYGGDISRKRKLLDKQKEGRKKMKQVGQVSIPQEAFISVLKSDVVES